MSMNKSIAKALIAYIVKNYPDAYDGLTKTKLMKLVFLVDYEYYRRYKRTLTGATYVKYFYGPFSKEIAEILDEMVAHDLIQMESGISSSGNIYYVYKPTLLTEQLTHVVEKDPQIKRIVDSVIRENIAPLEKILEKVYAIEKVKKSEFLERIL